MLVTVPVDNLDLVVGRTLELVDKVVDIVYDLLVQAGIELHTAGFGDDQLEVVVDELGVHVEQMVDDKQLVDEQSFDHTFAAEFAVADDFVADIYLETENGETKNVCK